ncbi:MAG: glutamate--tRNA ligase family protein [bacterium]|nr:glutamate--tRNA ligase family protein [bacterium]
MVRVRFAPSPTGFLHLGSGRTALFNYLFARSQGGTFVLRIEDTDRERSKKEFEEDIKHYLRWLGLDWDEGPDKGGDFGPYYQSERKERHVAAAMQLLDSGHAFRDPDDGTIRLNYPSEPIIVEDLICGTCSFAPDSLGPEPVILRADGTPTFHLAVVVDDIDMKITHIIRGQDHLTNTAKHQILFNALCGEAPKFAHLPLILGEDGSKLSKRNSGGFVSVRDFAEKGYLPETLVNFLMLLGWSHPEGVEQLTLEEGVRSFSLDRVKGSSGARFEIQKLDWLNGWWIRNMPLERAAEAILPFTGEYGTVLKQRGEKYWLAVVSQLRDSISLLKDAEELARLLAVLQLDYSDDVFTLLGTEEVVGESLTVVDAWIAALRDLVLEDGEDSISAEDFTRILNQIKKHSGCKPKIVFQSLRAAVTGAVSGPELKILVPFIPRDLLVERAKAFRSALTGRDRD